MQAEAEGKIPHGNRPAARLYTWAGLLVIWTVAWSTPTGQIGEDTKNDLYVDAWGLLRRALHLWDSQVTWGMLQNQGYGYLFPMGPWYAVLGEILPVWVVERLWWSALLTAGYLATLALARALGYAGDPGYAGAGAVHVGALAYTLAPRVLSTLGAISPEAQTQLLAPAILLPLVWAAAGRVAARRAAALSGVAILLCGGVNATATLLAAVPAGIWLVTRRRWWRSALTWWWALAAVAATAWWFGPLLLLGRYSPPFLNWIENAAVVLRPVGMLDVVKGTTHWLGHLLVPGGPWWPAGWALANGWSIVIATSLLGGIGLTGLLLPIRERRFLVLTLVAGLVLLTVPHAGPLDSPLAGAARDLLDGPLAPMRNVHKADPLVRLPLTIGLINTLRHAAAWLRARADAPGAGRHHTRLRPALATLAGLALVVTGAAPALAGVVATRGTFTAMPDHWREAGEWLTRHTGQGGAILLPAANFGEYTWGRTIDEPLRSLTTAPYAVRDAVPLTPAGTIRFLDEITRRAQSGRDLRGVGPALLASGVKYVVLRGDLDTALTGGPPVAVTRSALLDTPGIALVARFGPTSTDITGTRVAPVEIYAVTGRAAPRASLWPVTSVPIVSGASEVLPALAESGLAQGPVRFDGDADPGETNPRIETDSFRARDRYFGATRGQDVTRTLTAGETDASTDYFPWSHGRLRSTITYGGGIAGVSASTALGDQLTLAGLAPARRPYAALDGDQATAWLTFGDAAPTLAVTFPAERSVHTVRVRPAADPDLFGAGISAPTSVRISLGGKSIDTEIGASAPVSLPAGMRGRELEVRILDTADGAPGTVLTGLAEVGIDDLAPTETVRLPQPVTRGVTQGFVLSRDSDAADGCIRTAGGFQCLGGGYRPAEESGTLRREVTTTAGGSYAVSGRLVADPAHPSSALTIPGVREITASSTRTLGLPGAPRAVLDGDPETAWSPAAGDRSPTVTVRFAALVRTAALRLRTRADWLADNAPIAVAVTRGADRDVTTLGADGRIDVPARTSDTLSLQLLPDAGTRPAASLELAELTISGFTSQPATAPIGAPCGSGPRVTVNGRAVPTSVLGARRALVGEGSLVWQACDPVRLAAGPNAVTVEPWRDLVPVQVIGRTGEGAVAGSIVAAGVDAQLAEGEGGRLDGTIEAAAYDRLLALTQNANAGWRARIGDRALAASTVDGYRQAFVVPAGVGGQVRVDFGPDGAYRLALGCGALIALGLVLAAAWPGRRRPGPGGREFGDPEFGDPEFGDPEFGDPEFGDPEFGDPEFGREFGREPAAAVPAAPSARRAGLQVVGVIGLAILIAGWAGLVVALACVVAIRMLPRLPLGVLAPVLLAGAAGIVQALAASGTGPGSPAVESVTRVLSLAAVLLALLGPAHLRPSGLPIRERAPAHAAAAPPSASRAVRPTGSSRRQARA